MDLEIRLNPRVIAATDGRPVAWEMKRIGCQAAGIRKMFPKARAYAVRLDGLDRIEANILKQGMLSVGGDLALHKLVITEQVEASNAVLVGSEAQIATMADRLQEQPWKLPEIGRLIRETLRRHEARAFRLPCPGGPLDLGAETALMGIVNVTPDSFSDGGKLPTAQAAIDHGLRLAEAGARIVDVGGESTRPGSDRVPEEEELRRVLPVVEGLTRRKTLVSIDTRKSGVARRAFEAGAGILNDVSALAHDPGMAATAARAGVPVILMHMRGDPKTMQRDPKYEDVVGDVLRSLRESVNRALQAGVSRDRILVDPGIGFGKTAEHSRELLRRLSELRSLGRPVVVGASRKSFIGHFLRKPVDQRLLGTAAAVAASILRGAAVVRVHDVAEIAEVARMCDLLR